MLPATCLSCLSHLMHLQGMIEKEVEYYSIDRVVSLPVQSLSLNQVHSSTEAVLAWYGRDFSHVRTVSRARPRGATSLARGSIPLSRWYQLVAHGTQSRNFLPLNRLAREHSLQEQTCSFDLSHLSLVDETVTTPSATDGVWTNRMTSHSSHHVRFRA